MTLYNSISEIKKDFQVDSDNLDVIRDHVNNVRVNNHPDKTNGEFKDDGHKTLFHKANQAIEYIDAVKNNHSLVVVEKMTDLMKVVTELLPANKQNTLEQNLDTKISFAITTFRSKFFVPKISLTALTAIVTFLFLFPAQIKDNPTLSHYINPTSGPFAVMWLTLLVYSGLFWMMAFSSDEKAKKKLILLKVDSIQNRLFEDFVRTESSRNIFAKDQLTDFIHKRSNNYKFDDSVRSSGLSLITTRLFSSETITLEISQSIAELIITRAEKNNVIAKMTGNSLSDCYEIKNFR